MVVVTTSFGIAQSCSHKTALCTMQAKDVKLRTTTSLSYRGIFMRPGKLYVRRFAVF